jgi:hypothetical protein
LITNGKRAAQVSGASTPTATDAEATSFHTPRPGFMLVGAGAVAVFLLFDLMPSPVATPSAHAPRIPNLIWKLPPVPARIAWNIYSRMWEGVTPIRASYNPVAGPWNVLEKAMTDFANSNGVTIVYFADAGSTQAYVCVSNKDARAMRSFLHSLTQKTNTPLSTPLSTR